MRAESARYARLHREASRRRAVAAAVCGALLAGLYISGCSSEDEPADAGRAEANQAWCESVCGTFQRCEGSVPQTCPATCQRTNYAYLVRTTPRALVAEAACLTSSSACPEGVFMECYGAAREQLEPTSAAEQFCEAMARVFFECAWFSTPALCAKEHARYSSQALAAGARCAEVRCEDLEPCLNTTLWTYGS